MNDHALLTTSVTFSFNRTTGHWTLYGQANEGYLGTRTVSPKDMLEIAKGLDHVFFGPDVNSTWRGRTVYADLINDVHAAAKRVLADELKGLEQAIARREAKRTALAALEEVSP